MLGLFDDTLRFSAYSNAFWEHPHGPVAANLPQHIQVRKENHFLITPSSLLGITHNVAVTCSLGRGI